MDYHQLNARLRNQYTSATELEQIFDYLQIDVFKSLIEYKQQILDEIKHWLEFYTIIKHAKNWAQLKSAVKKYLILENNQNVKSKYNIITSIIRAVIYQLWWKLNCLYHSRDLDDGIKLFRQMADEIATEYGLGNKLILTDRIYI